MPHRSRAYKSGYRKVKHDFSFQRICAKILHKLSQAKGSVHGESNNVGLSDMHLGCPYNEINVTAATGRAESETSNVYNLFSNVRSKNLLLSL